MNKSQLRKTAKQLLAGLENKQKRSEDLVDRFLEKGILDELTFISVFSSLPDEIDTLPLVQECWRRNIKVCVPVFDRMMNEKADTLQEWVYDASLKEMDFGIRMPEYGPTHLVMEMDLIVVPGMAFTHEGQRLGRGKGFYDRFLKDFQGSTIGVCFKEQLLKDLPVDDHDIVLDQVLTV